MPKAKEDTTSTLRVTEDLKRQLRMIAGELMSKDGKDRSFEDVIQHLINEYRK